jgi:hypothetical protein
MLEKLGLAIRPRKPGTVTCVFGLTNFSGGRMNNSGLREYRAVGGALTYAKLQPMRGARRWVHL